MRKILIWILSILIIAQIAYAGVTNPLPPELNLYQGESGRFKFQIQTIAGDQEVECSYYQAVEDSPLIVEFDPAEIIVPAGTVKEVRGTVSVPDDLDFGTYEEEFCISCSPTQGAAGAAVKVDTCGLPIKVNVIAEERTRENLYVPPKPFPLIGKVLIIAAVLLAIIIYYLWKQGYLVKKKPAKKKKKK